MNRWRVRTDQCTDVASITAECGFISRLNLQHNTLDSRWSHTIARERSKA